MSSNTTAKTKTSRSTTATTPALSKNRPTHQPNSPKSRRKLQTQRLSNPKSSSHASRQSLKLKPTRLPLPKATWRLLFNQIILLFTIGCIFGTYYEEILTLCKHFFADGTIEWLSRSGMVYGPFSPVYGLGAVGVYLIFYRTRANWQTCFFGGALAGGALEYGLSVAQEWLFETRSWDYSNLFLNIGGRTTVPYMLFWGLLVLLAAHWLFPLLEGAYKRLEGEWLNIFCVGLAIFLALDAGISIAANLRETERHEGDPANTAVDEFLDEHYPDERMEEIYENMVPVQEDQK